MQQPEREVFFWHVLSPDSAQFKRGTGMLEMFSRFVNVGLGMVACLHVIFKPAWNNFICVYLCMCFISTESKQNKQTAVDVKHWNEARQLM